MYLVIDELTEAIDSEITRRKELRDEERALSAATAGSDVSGSGGKGLPPITLTESDRRRISRALQVCSCSYFIIT